MAEVIEDVWVVESEISGSRLFMQWESAVPVIRDMLKRGERVSLELAPVLNVIPDRCVYCDSVKPRGMSCGCFDNGGQ